MNDFGERLATVETEVASLSEHLVEIRAEQVRHRERLDALRDHTDRSWAALRDHTDRALAELREHTDRGLAQLREHTDRSLAELRDHTDRGFAEIRANLEEIRREQARTTRWLVGLAIGYGTAIIGMMAKMTGIF
jgi:DNA anti-recombination protein RmuC